MDCVHQLNLTNRISLVASFSSLNHFLIDIFFSIYIGSTNKIFSFPMDFQIFNGFSNLFVGLDQQDKIFCNADCFIL